MVTYAMNFLGFRIDLQTNEIYFLLILIMFYCMTPHAYYRDSGAV